jgi:cell division protein ZapA
MMGTVSNGTGTSGRGTAPILRVEIFGQFYPIRASEDGDYLKGLAEFVDQRMREIARSSTTADSVKIAVLAALNIADELHRLKNQAEQADAQLAACSAQYAQLLDGLLKPRNPDEKAGQPAPSTPPV